MRKQFITAAPAYSAGAVAFNKKEKILIENTVEILNISRFKWAGIELF
jgi:hypothetical protein